MLEDLRKILKKKDQDKELTLPTFKINISHFPCPNTENNTNGGYSALHQITLGERLNHRVLTKIASWSVTAIIVKINVFFQELSEETYHSTHLI